ncbi:MAG: hypothetical protein JRH16_13740 [Deltaproteobacteria bacterium]|nr:hypothetical protein [Deltaproteobacteria bacterium]MBW2361577.1 hypothetical protein [Deltaproteobacteria bacterium]
MPSTRRSWFDATTKDDCATRHETRSTHPMDITTLAAWGEFIGGIAADLR